MKKRTMMIYAMAISMTMGLIAPVVVSAEEAVTFQFIQAQPEYQTAAQKLVQAYMDEHPNVTIELITKHLLKEKSLRR